jgi:polyisoprenoid-binding protein YceI
MTTYDASTAECCVFTFKEGLLSPVAHDLRLRVTRFEIEVGAVVAATFDATSLVVDAPMRDGRENPNALTAADKTKIAGQIRDDVLHASRYPRITFRSLALTARSDGGYDLQGELTLHGVTKSLAAQTRLVNGRQQLELTLHQPDYGITPYRAMLGTLKIQPDVTVRIIA